MIPESHASIKTDHILDVALHHEIKCRAYELYELRRDTVDGHDLPTICWREDSTA